MCVIETQNYELLTVFTQKILELLLDTAVYIICLPFSSSFGHT